MQVARGKIVASNFTNKGLVQHCNRKKIVVQKQGFELEIKVMIKTREMPQNRKTTKERKEA